MQTFNILSQTRNRTLGVLILIVLLTSGIFLSGCNTNTELNNEINNSGQETSETEADGADIITANLIETKTDINQDQPVLSEQELSLEGYGAIGALADRDLSIADMLMYAVQDEYLAHGEYEAIIDKFGDQTPYNNIIRAEETHLTYLENIYTEYEMTFPSDTSSEHLVIPVNLLEAAQTGVQAEIDNIAMYEIFLTYDLPENIQQVFSSLKSGSDSHLLAFQKQVDKLSR